MGSTKGEITGITVGYESSQCGTNYGNPALTCTIYGGPLNFPWSSTSDARVSTSNSTPNLQFSNTGALTGFNTPLSSDTGTTFSANLSSGGMTLDGVNIFTSLPTGLAQIQEGLWMEGIANPLIGHLHCTNTNRYCEYYAYGQPLDGGVFYNHDSLQGASAGLIDLGYGIDNNQSLISFSALNGNIIYDQKNKFTLTSSSAVTKVGQYFPQGLALYTHLNNPPLPSGTSDNVGKCTLAPVSNPPTCFVGFSVPWNSPPVCTASNQTNTAAVKVIANTSGVTLVGATAGDVVAFQCEGNPN